jgi:hypothetical protein
LKASCTEKSPLFVQRSTAPSRQTFDNRHNVIVAKAAFVAAVEQRAGKRLKLTRGAQVHADSGDKR